MKTLIRMLSRLQDWHWARQWRRQEDRARAAWLASPKYAQILACKHVNRRPNGSTPNGWPAEVCHDCGTGVVTMRQGRRP
jgi:hypothetical protein